jgi:hypothetical protein
VLESRYGHSATSTFGWHRVGNVPVLVASGLDNNTWMWLHSGVLYRVEGPDGVGDYVTAVISVQYPNKAPVPADEIAFLEGEPPTRLPPIAGYQYTVPAHPMELSGLDTSTKDVIGPHYALRIVSRAGTVVKTLNANQVAISGGPTPLFLEATEPDLLDWFDVSHSMTPGAPDQNGVQVITVTAVPVGASQLVVGVARRADPDVRVGPHTRGLRQARAVPSSAHRRRGGGAHRRDFLVVEPMSPRAIPLHERVTKAETALGSPSSQDHD